MTRNNFITIDLRTIKNEELLKLRYINRLFDAVCKEMEDRSIGDLLMTSLYFPNRYGKYQTLDEYLSTFPQPQDNRTDGSC